MGVQRSARVYAVYLQWHYAVPAKQIVVIVDTWYLVELRVSTALHALYEVVLVLVHAVLGGRVIADVTAALLVQLLNDLLHLGHPLRQL